VICPWSAHGVPMGRAYRRSITGSLRQRAGTAGSCGVPAWMEQWLADWFDDTSLAAQAVDVAARGRLPQEAVGRVALRDRPLRDLIGR
jgi:hypothetical protein